MDNSTGLVEPLVSVCIPTYNRAIKLKRAVDALMVCTYGNLEIIISDNASPDDTESICAALTLSDSRVKYFRHPENQGPTKNFEYARAQATGKYFLWHGDDDYLDPDYIRICVEELERDPSLVLSSGLAAYHSSDNWLTHYGNVIQLDSGSPFFRVLKYLWYVGDNSIFYGVYHVDRVFDCRLPNFLAGDWAWMANVLLRGKTKVVPSVYVHRDFEDSISASITHIVSVIEAPRWHAKMPWIAKSVYIASYLILKSSEYKNKTITKKIIGYLAIFGVLFLKGIKANIRLFGSKVPFAKKIYRRSNPKFPPKFLP